MMVMIDSFYLRIWRWPRRLKRNVQNSKPVAGAIDKKWLLFAHFGPEPISFPLLAQMKFSGLVGGELALQPGDLGDGHGAEWNSGDVAWEQAWTVELAMTRGDNSFHLVDNLSCRMWNAFDGWARWLEAAVTRLTVARETNLQEEFSLKQKYK